MSNVHRVYALRSAQFFIIFFFPQYVAVSYVSRVLCWSLKAQLSLAYLQRQGTLMRVRCYQPTSDFLEMVRPSYVVVNKSMVSVAVWQLSHPIETTSLSDGALAFASF